MKFAKLYMALAGASALFGAVACSEVTEPVFQEPTGADFTILTPPLQSQYFGLTEEGTFDLTLSGQPDYGVSVVTNYFAEVALDENFTETRILTPTGTGTLSRMNLKDHALAIAINELHGVLEKDQYKDLGEEKIFFRGIAEVNGVEGSRITTKNFVTLDRVQNYFANAKPGEIYCIGNYAGDWIGPMEENLADLEPYTLKEEEIGSKIYYGTITFTKDAPIFRFYTALGSWDENSLGAAGGEDADKPVEFPEFLAGTQNFNMAKTKDSFSFTGLTTPVTLNFKVDNSSSSPVMEVTVVE